jgi:nicotinate-nucleotide adenylyltransferase
MNIGICGGTFDPFHHGHLDPVLAVRGTMQWDRVLYIPAFVQPFKQDRAMASPWHRFAMLTAATLGHDFVFASTMELDRGQISYSVDTLEALRAAHPDDNLPQLLEWRSIDRIFELANFAVLTRGNYEAPPSLVSRVREPESRSSNGAIVFAHNPTVPVSSTEIRRRIEADQPIDELVPPPVSRYIQHYGLYRKAILEQLAQ